MIRTHVHSMPHRAPRVQLSQVAYEPEYTPAKLITAILMTDLTTSDSAVFGWITSYFDGDLMSWNTYPQMVILKNLFIGAGTYMFSGVTGDVCIARWRRYGDDDIEYQIINKPCAPAEILEPSVGTQDPDPQPDPEPDQPDDPPPQ